MVRIPTLDTPATETDRYCSAGAEIIVAVPRDETVVFIKKRLSIREILPYLKEQDYAILEGFENEPSFPRIIAAKTAEEVKSYLDDSTIAVSGLIMGSENECEKAKVFGIPMFKSLTETEKLADLAIKKAVTPPTTKKRFT
jgi:molybdopterin-guanine dinucleotide biosynthesis protein MobB